MAGTTLTAPFGDNNDREGSKQRRMSGVPRTLLSCHDPVNLLRKLFF